MVKFPQSLIIFKLVFLKYYPNENNDNLLLRKFKKMIKINNENSQTYIVNTSQFT